MKSFTDLEQSKKLAEILPIESADMAWCNNSIKGVNYTDKFSANLYTIKEMKDVFDTALNGWDKYWELVPCWSLSALMEVIKEHDDYTLDICFGGYEGEKYVREWCCTYEQDIPPYNDILSHAENVIDACVEMVIKLHELHLL